MEPQASNDEIAIGDQVILMEKSFSNDAQKVTAKVVDIREILGKKTFVIETITGNLKVVGPKQISRAG